MLLVNLERGIDVGADGGAAGLQDVRRAQGGGGHSSALQPRVLFQI